MLTRRKAFTLVELVIYMFLMVVLLGIVFRMAIVNRRQMEKPAAGFRAVQTFLSLQSILNRDLQETDLSTVRIYPNPRFPGAPPGMSLASPRGLADDAVKMTPQGGVLWQKIIYYYVMPDPSRPGTGRLVRKEGLVPGLPSTKPVASAFEPSVAGFDRGRRRFVATNILLANQEIPQLKLSLGRHGGFEAVFMDGEGKTSPAYTPRHPLIVLNLTVREISPATGKPTVMRYQVRACPGR
jgi:type II secretory pathway pseudopilin PulG